MRAICSDMLFLTPLPDLAFPITATQTEPFLKKVPDPPCEPSLLRLALLLSWSIPGFVIVSPCVVAITCRSDGVGFLEPSQHRANGHGLLHTWSTPWMGFMCESGRLPLLPLASFCWPEDMLVSEAWVIRGSFDSTFPQSAFRGCISKGCDFE
ncbi:uncharacterized protein PV07_02569 [Cladophialophora immunda]|uniref:Uncharacterized protein n=1 Tax=Cladophialophora immunda TaxID=569365 RepID=A0A0D2AZZ8_9EURO|nr:uncharacterized protein PV07_02569 [Cladophialophora immunda]KIW30877.1 hypothetical protein PV07_02569 [Cladophialophora immunda]